MPRRLVAVATLLTVLSAITIGTRWLFFPGTEASPWPTLVAGEGAVIGVGLLLAISWLLISRNRPSWVALQAVVGIAIVDAVGWIVVAAMAVGEGPQGQGALHAMVVVWAIGRVGWSVLKTILLVTCLRSLRGEQVREWLAQTDREAPTQF